MIATVAHISNNTQSHRRAKGEQSPSGAPTDIGVIEHRVRAQPVRVLCFNYTLGSGGIIHVHVPSTFPQ